MLKQITFALAAIALLPGLALGQAFPSKPLRFIVGFPPGGGSDLAARVVASGLEKRVGQPVVVDNRPGAFGTIAGLAVTRAEPDGYTLYFGNIGSSHPLFVRSNGIDANKELAPVSMLMSGSFAFSMKQGLPARTFGELVAYSKANPGKLNYGSVGNTTDLMGEVLRQRTGLVATTITYKGDTPAMTALIAGEIDFSGNSITGAAPHILSGKVVPLFVAKGTRSSFLPNVPTAAEVGIRDFEIGYTLGIWAPRGTPRPVIDKLSSESSAVAKSPDVVERFRTIGGEPLGTSPEEMTRIYDTEMKFWEEAARLAKFQPQ
jgi:tripartite-type tricarboxylate transporter receptor subunit TctC